MSRTVKNEYMVLQNIQLQMYKATNTDTINKVYRQARTWARFQHFFGYGMSYTKYRWIINKIKHYKAEAKKSLY